MGDFLPAYEDADRLTFTAGGTITGGQLVEVTTGATTPPTVVATSGVSSKVVGVALFDAVSGGLVTVTRTGACDLATTANVAIGDHVTSSTTGGVAPIGAGTFVQDIGVSLTAATSPAVARVLLKLQ